MNKTKGVARIFGRADATKIFTFSKKQQKKGCHIFFGFFHQNRTLIWPTYYTFLWPMRRHEAPPIDLRQRLSPNWGLGGEAPGKILRFYVNFRLREHTCQWHCYKKSYFFANRLEAKCPLPLQLTFMRCTKLVS